MGLNSCRTLQLMRVLNSEEQVFLVVVSHAPHRLCHSRNPISRIGVALTTAAACCFSSSWHSTSSASSGPVRRPRRVRDGAGAVRRWVAPDIHFGVAREHRREARGLAPPAWPRIDLNDAGIHPTLSWLIGATLVNVAVVSFAGYGAVEYTESQTFCGQACHAVMEPEFVAHQNGPHRASPLRGVPCRPRG